MTELRELLDIRDWQATPAGSLFSAAACVLEASRLVREGVAPHSALCTAAARLGLEPDTIRSQCSRWSGVQHAHTVRGASATSLVRDAADALRPEDAA